MRLILGTIIFWIIIFGIKKFLEKKLKIDSAFTLAITFSLIGIIMFISGILNIMPLIAILLSISSIIYLIYSLHKEKPTLKDLKKNIIKPSVYIPIIIFIYITIIGMNMHLTHYDNFSHWGLIIKNILLDGALPNFEDTMIMFKGYQPGSACFIYLYGLLAGNKEGTMIIAQNYLIFAYLTPLFKFIKGNNKLIKNLLIIAFYIFIMTVSIKFNDLLVDSLISTMTIASLSVITYYKKDLKKSFWYSIPITLFIFLVKNTGFLIGIINSIYILYLAKKNKNIKEGWKYTFLTLLILSSTLLIWQGHVKLVFGDLALHSKHSLSSDNVILSLRTKGWDKIFELIKAYALHFFTFKNNITNIFMLIINAVLLLFSVTEKDKKERKNILLLTGTVDILYLIYYGVIGGMYLFSMPWEEAIVFAGYERYMTTITLIIIGIVLLYLLGYSERKNNYKLLMIPSIILMLIPLFIFKGNTNALMGQDWYQGTKVNRYDMILEEYNIKKTTATYYIYSPSSKDDFSYLHFVSKYKLNSGNVEMIYSKEDLNLTNPGILIFFDEDKELMKEAKEKGWINKTELIYEK